MDADFLEQVRDFCREVDLRLCGARENGEAAQAGISSLSPRQSERLSAAMSEVSLLLRASAIRVEPELADSADGQWCVNEYFRELGRRFDAGFDSAASNPADLEMLRPPNGAFVIARLDGRAIGCGALKSTGSGVGEIKRMWVAADARGLGVGRRIVEALEAQAMALGFALLRLETNKNLSEVISLYRSSGFRGVQPSMTSSMRTLVRKGADGDVRRAPRASDQGSRRLA
ncbi:GNAT family N-acetyltransferase [Breoghania sp.]|uniref:GNAT family N-acetyltransferase n=1 Tax=Breoghania sp. TaxID=2065378 RepID=UPI00262E6779|nr:GNAT family N-acetyltransferase [Breoghania sp.]MDJ0932610.1 GNAT family N-acetyltransferase [Breoghania sp.]